MSTRSSVHFQSLGESSPLGLPSDPTGPASSLTIQVALPEQMDPAIASSIQLALGRIVGNLYTLIGEKIVSRADMIEEILIAGVEPSAELIEERSARQRTINTIIERCTWVSCAKLEGARAAGTLSHASVSTLPLVDWKRRKRIFSVRIGKIDYFPEFQFDASGTPLTVIKDILSALGEVADPWSIAAWFVFPNNWVTDPASDSGVGVAPKDLLDHGSILIEAAKRRRGTYHA